MNTNSNIVLDSSLSISNSSSNNTSPILKNNSILFEKKFNIIPVCKYFPQYNFSSFIKDKLNALSPVEMEEDENEIYEHSSNDDKEIYVEDISEGFESSVF
jgi:hypothetical protein